MKNPKIRIESDGHVTEVYIDGKKIERCTMADFYFHAEPMKVDFEYQKYVTDDNGNLVVEENEIIREKHKLLFD